LFFQNALNALQHMHMKNTVNLPGWVVTTGAAGMLGWLVFANPPWGGETPDIAVAGEKGLGGATVEVNGCGTLGLATGFVG